MRRIAPLSIALDAVPDTGIAAQQRFTPRRRDVPLAAQPQAEPAAPLPAPEPASSPEPQHASHAAFTVALLTLQQHRGSLDERPAPASGELPSQGSLPLTDLLV